MRAGLVASCHDLSEGGLAVAAAEMAFSGELGLELDISQAACAQLAANCDARAVLLFSESCTRFLVEVAAPHTAAFERCFIDLDCARIGTTTSARRLVLRDADATAVIDVSIDDLRAAHQGGFQG